MSAVLMTEERWLSGTDADAEMFNYVKRANPSPRKFWLLACACARSFAKAVGRTNNPYLRRSLAAAESRAERIIPFPQLSDSHHWEEPACYLSEAEPDRAAAHFFRPPSRSVIAPSVLAELLRQIFGNPFRPSGPQPFWTPPRHCMISNEDLECVGCGAKLRLLKSGRCAEAPPPWPPAWLTPEIRALARAAYNDRPDKACQSCLGGGKAVASSRELLALARAFPGDDARQKSLLADCPVCLGEKSISLGELARDRLLVLSDALEDAGCEDRMVLDQLRTDRPCYRGLWPLDVILGYP